MTQDEIHRLLVEVVDEVNSISYYRHYLKIALDLMDSPNDETLEKVELLISTFLQQVDCHFENVEFCFKDLKKSCKQKSDSI